MKRKSHIVNLLEQTEKMNISDVDSLDLPMEYEYISRKNSNHSSDYEWIMFKLRCKLIDYGIEITFDTRHLNQLLWDSSTMENKSKEKFGNMNDETFFNLYKNYKSNLLLF